MDLQIYLAGPETRIKFTSLQLARESGGSGLALRNYDLAALIAALLYRCNETYSWWKELEPGGPKHSTSGRRWSILVSYTECWEWLRLYSNRHDLRFKSWTVCDLTTQRNTAQLWDPARQTWRSYYDHVLIMNVNWLTFQMLSQNHYEKCQDRHPLWLISNLYTDLSPVNDNNTLYIKGKWERESGIKLHESTAGATLWDISGHCIR